MAQVCIICTEKPVATVFTPCGHMCLCEDCVPEDDDALHCMICRSPGICIKTFVAGFEDDEPAAPEPAAPEPEPAEPAPAPAPPVAPQQNLDQVRLGMNAFYAEQRRREMEPVAPPAPPVEPAPPPAAAPAAHGIAQHIDLVYATVSGRYRNPRATAQHTRNEQRARDELARGFVSGTVSARVGKRGRGFILKKNNVLQLSALRAITEVTDTDVVFGGTRKQLRVPKGWAFVKI